ncbi:aspartate kinase [Clostridium sediminicola]|uniref:aspartate kinase n=1 Tax=Clostridium sediminicola TaxID=3114879 RepID=UPI0031F23B2E
MKIIVQKFGGTSVSDDYTRSCVVKKIQEALESGFSPIVVVSAMGRKGKPYATDTLLSLIDSDFKKKNAKATDLLMCCGEIISTVVMCNELNKYNIEVQPLTGGQAGIITDTQYTNATVLDVKKENLLNIINEGKVPVVAGFQGISEDGYFTTLGRGGSDVTAALIGTAVKAEGIEIYTDVDGIMTADPRLVDSAALIKQISYNEVFQFADQGAKVIHPKAVEIAMKGNVPLLIKNTTTNSSGTTIDNSGDCNSENIITGITHMDKRTQVKVRLNDNLDNENYHMILPTLANNGISIDLINVFPNEKIFTIDKADIKKFEIIMKQLGLKYKALLNCSKIAIIGSRMRGIPGVMARILKALTMSKIEVLQTADSHTTIWCLVNEESTQKAINALHNEFSLHQYK